MAFLNFPNSKFETQPLAVKAHFSAPGKPSLRMIGDNRAVGVFFVDEAPG